MKTGITIVGSYNVGLFLKGDRLPQKGETVIGDSFRESGGGKGSNQAIAAAVLGAKASFVCRIGNDKYGKDALALYNRVGISTEYILESNTTHSGISVILIDNAGNNMISVVPGANFLLSKQDIDKARPLFEQSAWVAFQLENNLETVLYGIDTAHQLGAHVLLDPAPATQLPQNVFPKLDIIKPNETEASIVTGITVTDIESAARAGKWLVEKGVKIAIVTLGASGAVVVTTDTTRHYPAPTVNCVDATGAGDIFSGALLSALCKHTPLPDAVWYANHAAALACTKLGVIEAIPCHDEVVNFLENSGLRKEAAHA